MNRMKNSGVLDDYVVNTNIKLALFWVALMALPSVMVLLLLFII